MDSSILPCDGVTHPPPSPCLPKDRGCSCPKEKQIEIPEVVKIINSCAKCLETSGLGLIQKPDRCKKARVYSNKVSGHSKYTPGFILISEIRFNAKNNYIEHVIKGFL